MLNTYDFFESRLQVPVSNFLVTDLLTNLITLGICRGAFTPKNAYHAVNNYMDTERVTKKGYLFSDYKQMSKSLQKYFKLSLVHN